MIKTFKQRESQVLMSSSLGNNLVRWLRENSNEPDEKIEKREREETKFPIGTEIKMICCGNKSEAI